METTPTNNRLCAFFASLRLCVKRFLELATLSVIVLCLASHSRAAEPATDWDKVVESLASPNAPPEIERGHELRKVPEGYDLEAQHKVYDAWDQLLAAGTAAFPALIEHFDDKRYCSTVESTLSGASHNQSVGRVCREIVVGQIASIGPFTSGRGDPRSRPVRPNYCFTFLRDTKAAKAWWEAHKDKSLCDIQIEALRWTVAEEEKRNLPADKQDIEKLNAMLTKLVDSATPLKGKRQATTRFHSGEDR